MRISGPGKRLRIYVSDGDQWQGRALYLALLETLRREGLAGATVTRGLAGFGAHSRVHLATIETLAAELPLIIEVVDAPQRIDQALVLISPMVSEGLITVEDVQIVKYTHRYLHPLPGDKMVREVMTQAVVTVEPGTPVADVMDLLLGRQIRAVPVVDKARQVVGLISDGDLLTRGGVLTPLSVAERFDRETLAAHLAEIRQAGKTAREVLTAPVVTVRDDAALAHAVSVMADRNLKRLPVVDKHGRLVGILSRQDVLRTVAAAHPAAAASAGPPPGAAQTVGEVMDPEVPVMPLDADLAEIVEKMVTSELKRVIVVDGEGRAVGMIKDGDLVARVRPEARPGLLQALRQFGRPEHLPNVPAAELMSSAVLLGPADTPIAEAIRQMVLQQRQRFVVVDAAGRPIGIVDRQRLVRAVAGR
jgi:CBS-domain-containing membrane protein/PII-like signaling protein